jgi:hypothetical protein
MLRIVLSVLAPPAVASAASAATLSVMHTFEGAPTDGAYPSGLVVDAANNVYGQTQAGGTVCQYSNRQQGCGIIYKIDPTGKITTFQTYTGLNGALGYSRLTLKGDRLYGSAFAGGADRGGVIFSIRTDGSNYKLLHQFGSPSGQGNSPSGTLAVDDNGIVYGTTMYGASNSYGGVLFSIGLDGTYTLLHSFITPPYGYSPTGVILKGGNLFGATGPGGDAGATLFEYSIATGAFTTLYTFPHGLTVTPQGTLVGVTKIGPLIRNKLTGYGTLFSYAAGTLTTLLSFNSLPATDGEYPSGAPAMTASGTIFGPTLAGGDSNCVISAQGVGCGVVFEYTP